MSPLTDLAPVALNDGKNLPAIGLGTFGMRGEDGIAAVLGYRLLDTAVGYGNEHEIGEALRRTSVPRDQLWVTSKIPGRDHGYDGTRQSIRGSLERLGLEQIDLHLIHWPIPRIGKYVDTWRALVAAQADGELRSIGVSNFTRSYLEPIIDATGVVPAVNQIELHPHFPQPDLRAVNRELGICTQSWSPLGRQRPLFDAEPISRPARRLDVTAGQVVLRWHHQLA
jgi:2,5-diketo-D-gluconate reductase A